MIRLGPAGVGGEILSGLSFIRDKGLTAAEIQFTRGVYMSIDKAKEVYELNKGLKLRLSVHAPYYINLASIEKDKVEASRKRILDSCERAHYMGADYVVFHPGFFMKRDSMKVYDIIKEQLLILQEEVRERGWDKVILAPETMGRLSQFGDLDELLRLRREVGCELCVDFSHLYARYQGNIDFGDVCERLSDITHVHAHFSGIEYTEKGEKRHLIMEKGFFRPLAAEILRRGMDITIISESPITWEDSLKMKEVFEEIKPQSI